MEQKNNRPKYKSHREYGQKEGTGVEKPEQTKIQTMRDEQVAREAAKELKRVKNRLKRGN